MTTMTLEQRNYSLIGSRLSTLRSQVAYAARNRNPKKYPPQMIVVSDGIYPEVIHRAYEEGQRHFGEYSITDLVIKANCGLITEYCPHIMWHYLGSMQTPEIYELGTVPHLFAVHTVESREDADILESIARQNEHIMILSGTVQVKTCKETSTAGVLPEDVVPLVRYITRNCHLLYPQGLMNVGSLKHDQRSDFATLNHLRESIQNQFQNDLDIVMGWSKDFKQAIEFGADFVRMEDGVFGYKTITV